MSNTSIVAAPSVSEALNPSETCLTPPARSNRSAGKGRRRRAVAEQRRAEQESWRHFLHNVEDDLYVAPATPPNSRRQLRRAARRSPHHEDWEDADHDHLDIALALSLSLLETPQGGDQPADDLSTPPANQPLDLSYESLVRLEDVKCTAPAALVRSLCGHIFDKDGGVNSLSIDERCTICQVEYKVGDSCMLLPCLHPLHDACGSEWFMNHSKLCPVCKHDITEQV